MSSLVAKSLPELTIDDAEFRIMRQRMTAEKKALEAQLAEINARCSTHLPQKEYHKQQSQRGQLSTVISVRTQRAFTVPQIRQLVEMRDRWHDFSMDAKRHQKERETWWHCSQELRDILKRHFDAGQIPT